MANKKIIPPMPFDATAWLSNNAAMRLSFACKGLWLDMFCCMWVSIERGVMTVSYTHLDVYKRQA